MKKIYRPLLYAIGGIAGIWLLLNFFLPVGLPFLLGWLLSALAAPPVRRIASRCSLPRGLISFFCVTLVSAILLLILWLLVQLAVSELEHLGKLLPDFISAFSDTFRQVHGSLLRLAAKLPDGMAQAAARWADKLFEGGSVLFSSASQWLLGLAAEIISRVPSLVLFLITTILSAYFFAADAPKIRLFLKKHIPETWAAKASAVGKRLKVALGGYLKAQWRLTLVTFGITFVGLLFLHPENSFLLALLIAVVDALPVFGAGTILIPWGIFCLLSNAVFTGIGLLLLYGIDSLTRTVLEPRFIGHQIGLSPLLTLFSLYAGFRLFGIAGMILLPIAVILLKQLYDIIETA